jgi:hypothetical protein
MIKNKVQLKLALKNLDEYHQLIDELDENYSNIDQLDYIFFKGYYTSKIFTLGLDIKEYYENCSLV